MTNTFGSIIPQILSKVQKHIIRGYRSLSIFGRKKDHQLSPYIIVKATKDDFYDIIKLKHESYDRDEPTSFSLGICQNTFLDESAMSAMSEGYTLVAKCKYDGNVVGAVINESTHPWDPDVNEKMACSIRCPKVRQLLLFYAHIQRVPDIWNRYRVQKVFEMSQLFVRKQHRNHGLAMKLLLESREIAADCGFKVVRCDATNYYTAKMCEKMKMRLIAEIPYCSYLGKNLEPVFCPPYPHEAVKIYVDVNPQTST